MFFSRLVPSAVVLLVSTTAAADALRATADITSSRFGEKFDWFSPNRFVGVDRGGQKDAQGQLVTRIHVIFDLRERVLQDVQIPVAGFDQRFNEKFLVPEVVHYDGQRLSFWVEVKREEIYAGQVDVRSGELSSFTKLGNKGKDRFFKPIGVDEKEQYFYYGFLLAEGEGPDRETPSMDIGRYNLRERTVDWEYALRPPARNRPLGLRFMELDHGGKQLAVFEYNDSAHEREARASVPQQVYVIDIDAKTMRSFPIPRTPYGRTFNRDDQHLFVGSWEEKKIVRIDLNAGKLDKTVATPGNVDDLDTTPTGESLMVFLTIRTSKEALFESRRTSDLKPIFDAPVRMLFPGTGAGGDGSRTRDGKLWITALNGDDAKPKGKRLFEVPGIIDATGDSSSKDQLAIARGITAAKRFAQAKGIEVPGKEEELGDPARAFAAIVVKPKGDIYLTGTAGEGQRPMVVRLGKEGKLKWERDLSTRDGVKEYVGARITVLDDGSVIAHVFDYYSPGGYPASRVVRLGANGKQLWEHRLGGTGGLGTPLPDTFDVQSGNVVMTGRIFRQKDRQERWSAVVGANGKVVSEKVGD